MPDPLDVLFVSHMGNYWGAERSLVTLIEALDPAAVRPLVLVPTRGALTKVLDRCSIPHFITGHTGWLGARNNAGKKILRATLNLASYLLASRRIRTRPVDLVYSNTLYSPLGALLARRRNVPHIWHVREFVHEDMNATFDFGTARSMRFVDRTASAIIFNSVAVMKKHAPSLRASKGCVVYNGFPGLEGEPPAATRKPPAPAGRWKLALVGRIEPAKGQAEAVRALGLLVEQGFRAELTLVGEGDARYTRRVRRIARDLGLGDRVDWRGFVSDPAEVYRSSDVVLVCSRSEAFGRVAIEAMAHGCPVVGTNSGGLPEIIEDGSNGLLYEPGNYRMLAERILHLAGDRDLYASISRRAPSSVYGRFTVERYATGVLRIIRQAHARGRGLSLPRDGAGHGVTSFPLSAP